MTLYATVGGHNKTQRTRTARRGRAKQELWTAGHATPGIEFDFCSRCRAILQDTNLIGSHVELLNRLGRAARCGTVRLDTPAGAPVRALLDKINGLVSLHGFRSRRGQRNA